MISIVTTRAHVLSQSLYGSSFSHLEVLFFHILCQISKTLFKWEWLVPLYSVNNHKSSFSRQQHEFEGCDSKRFPSYLHVYHFQFILDLYLFVLPHVFKVENGNSSSIVALPVGSMSILEILLFTFYFDEFIKFIFSHFPRDVEGADF